jgi:excisionase family DNA binding protein
MEGEVSERPLPLLDKTEAAEYLGVSIRTVDRLMRDKELSPIYVRSRPRFDYDDLRAFIERNRSGGDHAA